MIHRLMCFLALCSGLISLGQNLIPNPSFEDTLCSEEFEDHPGFFYLENWYNINTSSPDKYTILEEDVPCTFVSIYSPILLNSGEWQVPKEGENMVGLWYGDQVSTSRELISTRLVTPLLQDTDYCFSMYVSLGNRFDLAVDRLGAFFSLDSVYDYSTSGTVNFSFHVLTPPNIFFTDTIEWMLVEGVYSAQGGEEFITLGNALDDFQTNYLTVEGGGFDIAYYFVDDVQLVSCNSTYLGEYAEGVVIHSVLEQNSIKIFGPPGLIWELFDLNGKRIYSGKLLGEEEVFQIPTLGYSIYLLNWRYQDQAGVQKIVSMR